MPQVGTAEFVLGVSGGGGVSFECPQKPDAALGSMPGHSWRGAVPLWQDARFCLALI